MVHFGETEREESHGLKLGVGWICESSFRSFRLQCFWSYG